MRTDELAGWSRRQRAAVPTQQRGDGGCGFPGRIAWPAIKHSGRMCIDQQPTVLCARRRVQWLEEWGSLLTMLFECYRDRETQTEGVWADVVFV